MLAPALAFVGLAAVVSVVLFAVAASRAREHENSADQDRLHALSVDTRRFRFVSVLLGSALVGVYLGLTNFRLSWAVHFLMAAAVFCACMFGPAVAVRMPLRAAYARMRGIPVASMRSSYRLTIRSVINLAVAVLPIVAALASPVSLTGRILIVVIGFTVGYPVLFGLLAPLFAFLTAPVGLPDNVASRLSELSGQLGVRVRGRMTRTITSRVANAHQLGWIPGLRYVLVSSYLLQQLPAAEIDATLCHELGHAVHRDSLKRQFLSGLMAAPYGAALVFWIDHRADFVAFAVMMAAVFLTFAGSRLISSIAIRAELAADDLAVRLVDAQTVASGLTRLMQLNAINANPSRSWTRTVGHPAMGMRIARLEASSATS